ncbi:MAG: hypothetical protein JW816_03520 [Candidatus Buchananbacteria bacterium]|nr:hypothetical protein [Candidatus Buchananbacteria bacterium]
MAHFVKGTKAKKSTGRWFGLGKLNVAALNISVVVLIVCGVIGYVAQVNGLATKGYLIKDLQSQVNQLRDQNGQLQAQASDLQSLDSVKNKVSELNMVPVGQANYLSSSAVAVASAR